LSNCLVNSLLTNTSQITIDVSLVQADITNVNELERPHQPAQQSWHGYFVTHIFRSNKQHL